MSDSTQIKPVGLGTAMAAGAVVGAMAPSLKTKIATKVADYLEKSPKADAFVKSAAEKATKAKNSVKGAAAKFAEKTKLDKAAKVVSEKAGNFANKIKGTKTFQTIANSKFGTFVKNAAINVGKFLKKPAVIGALVGAFIYTAYKMVQQHQEKKAIEAISENLY